MGFWELLLTLLVALVVIGPQRLPSLARTMGRALGQFKSVTGHIQKEFDEQMKIDKLHQNTALAEEADKLYEQSDHV